MLFSAFGIKQELTMSPISPNSSPYSSPLPLRRQNSVTNRVQQLNTSYETSSSLTTQTETQGFLSSCNRWISSVVDYIQKCFSCLASFFTNPISRQAPISEPTTDGLTSGDYLFLTNMQNKFDNGTRTFPDLHYLYPNVPPLSLPSLTQRQVVEALDDFRQIQRPHIKIDAFNWVLSVNNSTDEIAMQFYNALPEDLKRKFREAIYIANGRNDENHGIGFGEHIIATNIRGALSRQAASNLIIDLLLNGLHSSRRER